MCNIIRVRIIIVIIIFIIVVIVRAKNQGSSSAKLNHHHQVAKISEILSISDDHMIHRFADQMVRWWCLMPFEGRRYECEFVPHRLLPQLTSVDLNKNMVPLRFMFSKSTWTDWVYNVHKHA